ncbi:MAG: TonB-dependent receptor domain-containing protein, partial [Terriglobia bacterium]
DFLLGESRLAARTLGLANTLFRATSFAVYAEDTWKINRKLTLSLGIRYENTPPFHDKYRGIMNLDLQSGILDATKVPVLTRPGAGGFHEGMFFHFADAIPKQAGDEFLGRATVRRDGNDFAPRIGIAYSPTDRWSVRTGFGLFYSQDTGNPRFDMGRNLAGRSNFSSDEERPNAALRDPWQFERQAFRCSDWESVCQGYPVILANFANRRTPYVAQWMLNVQRQVTENLAVEAGYLGNSGSKLERIVNINVPTLRTGPSDNRTFQQRQPWPVYNLIQEMGNLVNSNYHALNLKLQQRFSKGLTLLAGYTWSKAIDNGSGIREDPGDRLQPNNPYNLRAERGLSQFHVGHRFVSSVLYELPFGPGKPVAD